MWRHFRMFKVTGDELLLAHEDYWVVLTSCPLDD